ncbi:MAG: winged helix-turn-helix domain-containing protein [Holosporales bacterium]|jgi:DNA-binding winged helix-turn-helix (wHTH) protein|nr:winged helix-turn-helix domain-containing protein [Holosporales bacterium]
MSANDDDAPEESLREDADSLNVDDKEKSVVDDIFYNADYDDDEDELPRIDINELPKNAINRSFKPSIKPRSSFHYIPQALLSNKNESSSSKDFLAYGKNKLSQLQGVNQIQKYEKQQEIRRRIINKTGIVAYVGVEVDEDNKEGQRLHLVEFAKSIKRLALERFPDAEVKVSLSLPKIKEESGNGTQLLSEELRKNKKNGLGASLNQFNQSTEVRVNIPSKEVYVDDELKKLTTREFDLLVYLLRSMDKPVSREELIEHVWDDSNSAKGNSRTIDVHIRRLRKKLENSITVQTIRGYGYLFDRRNNIFLEE